MIAVVDYGLGNIGSIINAMGKFGIKAIKTNNPQELFQADALIFPGDGAAGKAMKNLKEGKLIKPIRAFISSGRPFLGICLGMQILLSFSEEGNVQCLNIIKGKVKKFNAGLKVPQIGWNQVRLQSSEFRVQNERKKIKNFFKNIPDGSYFYFINSFYCEPGDKSIVFAETEYGEKFCSVFIKNNITGVQFHPEKSGEIGLRLLKNFTEVTC
jgi:glutamine amidotransferase